MRVARKVHVANAEPGLLQLRVEGAKWFERDVLKNKYFAFSHVFILSNLSKKSGRFHKIIELQTFRTVQTTCSGRCHFATRRFFLPDTLDNRRDFNPVAQNSACRVFLESRSQFGNCIVTISPPTLLFARLMRPPCASTISRHSGKPRPLPVFLVE